RYTRGVLSLLLLGSLVALAAPAELDGPIGGEAVVQRPAPSRPQAPSPSALPGALRSILRDAPPCPARRTHCVGLALHVVVEENESVQTGAWVATQLSEANRQFAVIDTGFELISV